MQIEPLNIQSSGSGSNNIEIENNIGILSVDNITLNTPTNDSSFATGDDITFGFTPVGTNLSVCSLYGTWNGGWHLNESFAGTNVPAPDFEMTFNSGDGIYNSTFAEELSGNENDGVVNGATYLSTGGHDGGGAYDFTAASSEYIDIPNSQNYTGDISISVWVYPTGDLSADTFISKSHVNEFDLAFQGGNKVTSYGHQGTMNSNKVDFTTNTWYHIVVIYDETNSLRKIYVDGVLDTNNTLAQSSPNVGSTFNIGKRAGGTNYYDGRIDDVAIFKSVLSSDEVTALYSGSSGFASGVQANHTISSFSEEGSFDWNVLCNDTSSNENWAVSNYTFNVAPVSVTLNTPANDSSFSTGDNITFGFTPTGTNLSVCSLYGTWNGGWHLNESYYEYKNYMILMSLNDSEGVYNSTFAENLIGGINENATVNDALYNSTGAYYDFDGAGDYLLIDNNTNLKPSSEFSLVVKLRPQGLSSWQNIYSDWRYSGERAIHLGFNGNAWQSYFSGDGTAVQSFTRTQFTRNNTNLYKCVKQ